MKTAMRHFLILLASVALLACAGENPNDNGDGDGDGDGDVTPDTDDGVPNTNSDDNDDDFEHDFDPFAEYGDQNLPDEVLATLHSCGKVSTATVGRALAARGVDLANNANLSAGRLFRDNQVALGVSNYNTRVRESAIPSASGLTKLFDIIIAAAPEMIAAMPTLGACTHPTSGAVNMFNAEGTACTAAGIQCLTGETVDAATLDICNQVINRASTPAIGREMAVALLFGSSLSCE